MAADQRDVRKTLRQFGQIHRSRFGRSIATPGKPRTTTNMQPGMHIDMGLQFCCEPHDWIVVGMAAGDALGLAAKVFNPDAGAMADPFLDLGAALRGEPGIDRRASGQSVFITSENS